MGNKVTFYHQYISQTINDVQNSQDPNLIKQYQKQIDNLVSECNGIKKIIEDEEGKLLNLKIFFYGFI